MSDAQISTTKDEPHELILNLHTTTCASEGDIFRTLLVSNLMVCICNFINRKRILCPLLLILCATSQVFGSIVVISYELSTSLTQLSTSLTQVLSFFFLFFLLLLFTRSVVSNFLQPHELKQARLPCPSLSLRVCSNSCPWSW